MDTLKLAWKFLSFYDLSPHALVRLSQTYGLTGLGGVVDVRDLSTLAKVRQRLWEVIEQEPDLRVRQCVTHQFTLAHKALALRGQGLRARVRGWLVVIDGGKNRQAGVGQLRPPARYQGPR